MQVQAIAGAAREVAEAGGALEPEIMIPLVSHEAELERLRALVEREVSACFEDAKVRVPFRIGTMIEVPRAALTAGRIARSADFFSFGTNDLTQTTYALSRDDATRFLPTYVETGILTDDPFTSIDEDGIGVLIEIATREGRRVRPKLGLGICGEHGGDPKSIHFCARVGLDYVSCSPFRVPIARLAAARAALGVDP
jgi:pyruvate,orthophosphate dikinase